ncbi:MAG: hypothetical protein QOC94_2854, partial [Actinoplanes sp.]|nr:hypothetical protein [Actinoplanes sp.]
MIRIEGRTRAARFVLTATLATAAAVTGPAGPAFAGAPAIPPTGIVLDAGAEGAIADSYIVVLKPGSAAAAQVTSASQQLVRHYGGTVVSNYTATFRGFHARMTATGAARLAADPAVSYVEQDATVSTSATETDAPWGLDRIDQRARPLSGTYTSTTAAGVTAYLLDTGIRVSQHDFAGRASSGWDFIDYDANAADCNGHGTHVAGTIGARNNGSGAVGVAPGSKIWAVRVLGSNGSGMTSQVVCGIDWVTATRTDANPNNDIAVANMSLGGGSAPTADCGRAVGDAMHIAICNSVAAGVTYVVAAGNSGADEQNFSPASYPEVITVTAMGDSDGLPGARGGSLSCSGADDALASFSNYATRAVDIAHTIAAPGVCIRSTYPGGYATLSGTSMASPHVAGLVALCEGDGAAHGPCWGKTPAAVRDIVRQAAASQSAANPASGFAGDPTRPTGGRYYGYLGATGFAGTATPAPVVTLPANTAKPVVSGTAQVGATLASTTGAWSGTAPVLTQQWLRCTTTATTACTAISGATAASYALVTADVTRYVRVRVTAVNAKG